MFERLYTQGSYSKSSPGLFSSGRVGCVRTLGGRGLGAR